jgi:hypothetical protein
MPSFCQDILHPSSFREWPPLLTAFNRFLFHPHPDSVDASLLAEHPQMNPYNKREKGRVETLVHFWHQENLRASTVRPETFLPLVGRQSTDTMCEKLQNTLVRFTHFFT